MDSWEEIDEDVSLNKLFPAGGLARPVPRMYARLREEPRVGRSVSRPCSVWRNHDH